MLNQITYKSISNSKIRVRNSYTQRYHTNKDHIEHSLPSKILKKQHNHSFLPNLNILPTLKTYSLTKSRRITVPPISIDSSKPNQLKNTNPQSSLTDNMKQSETENFKNANSTQQSKPSFRTKKLLRTYIPIKTNFSSVFPQKPENSNHQNLNENELNKLQVEFHDLAQTSTTQRTLRCRNKDNKCLIAVSRKLPFSLERKSKRKYTQKTDFTNTNQQIFELDISVIMDESQAPDTPFIRRGSDLAAVFNFA